MDERVDRRTDFLKRRKIHPLLFPSFPRPLPCWGVFYALGDARVVTVSPGPGPAAPGRASSGQSLGAVLASGEGCGPPTLAPAPGAAAGCCPCLTLLFSFGRLAVRDHTYARAAAQVTPRRAPFTAVPAHRGRDSRQRAAVKLRETLPWTKSCESSFTPAAARGTGNTTSGHAQLPGRLTVSAHGRQPGQEPRESASSPHPHPPARAPPHHTPNPRKAPFLTHISPPPTKRLGCRLHGHHQLACCFSPPISFHLHAP